MSKQKSPYEWSGKKGADWGDGGGGRVDGWKNKTSFFVCVCERVCHNGTGFSRCLSFFSEKKLDSCVHVYINIFQQQSAALREKGGGDTRTQCHHVEDCHQVSSSSSFFAPCLFSLHIIIQLDSTLDETKLPSLQWRSTAQCRLFKGRWRQRRASRVKEFLV